LHGLVVSIATLAVCFALVAAKAPPASANEPITEGAPLSDFVEASKPEWNFARVLGHDSCWPTEAIYADGGLNPGAEPSTWPNSGSDCPTPDNKYPTYYSVKECNDSEIRVAYTIYIPNSGFKPSGHRHDFEGIVVVWKRDGDKWTRDRLLMSYHGKWPSQDWDSAESWNADFSSAGLGREHPRIFVGWGSHAMFNNQQTDVTDVLSQYGNDEYRHDKYPSSNFTLVEVTQDNDLGQKFSAEDTKKHFGAANSHPAYIATDLCKF
jgi:hypothetical protein